MVTTARVLHLLVGLSLLGSATAVSAHPRPAPAARATSARMKLERGPWDYVKATATTTRLARRPRDGALQRERFRYAIDWSQQALDGAVTAVRSRGTIIARPRQVTVAHRVLLRSVDTTPARQRDLEDEVARAYRWIDRTVGRYDLLRDAATGQPARLRLRPIFVTRPEDADWIADVDWKPELGERNALHLGGGVVSRETVGFGIGTEAFAAPSEYWPYRVEPLHERMSEGLMRKERSPLLPHSLHRVAELVEKATGGRFVPGPDLATRWPR